jgi:hypothetical protein
VTSRSLSQRNLKRRIDYTLKIINLPVEHISLHFDGLRLYPKPVDIDVYTKEAEAYITSVTGYTVAIAEKKHFFFLDALADKIKDRTVAGVNLCFKET